LETVRESLHDRVVQCGLWPLHYPDLTSCDFRLRKFQKINCIKQIRALLKD
jgi:hypothetical protein